MLRRVGRTPRGIHYESHENPGKPWVVLVMGFAGGLASWGERFLSRIAPHVSYVVMDNRGTGQSVKPEKPDDYLIRIMADDTAEVIREACQEPVHLIGYSMGGCIAQEVALNQLVRLSRLTLIASTAGGKNYHSPGAAVLKALAEPKGEKLLDYFVATWHVCMGKDTTEKHWTELREIFDEQSKHLTPRSAMRGHLHAYTTFDSGSRLGSLKVPTVIITGRDDPLTPLANSETLHSLIPGSRLEVLEGTKHNPHVECPGDLCQLLGIIS